MTTRVLTVLAASTLAALAACSSNTVPSAEPRIVQQEIPLRPGTGVVQAMNRAPAILSAAAGSSAGAGGMNRLTLRMDDGTIQYVDSDSTEVSVGSRVELTSDRMIRRL